MAQARLLCPTYMTVALHSSPSTALPPTEFLHCLPPTEPGQTTFRTWRGEGTSCFPNLHLRGLFYSRASSLLSISTRVRYTSLRDLISQGKNQEAHLSLWYLLNSLFSLSPVTNLWKCLGCSCLPLITLGEILTSLVQHNRLFCMVVWDGWQACALA